MLRITDHLRIARSNTAHQLKSALHFVLNFQTTKLRVFEIAHEIGTETHQDSVTRRDFNRRLTRSQYFVVLLERYFDHADLCALLRHHLVGNESGDHYCRVRGHHSS